MDVSHKSDRIGSYAHSEVLITTAAVEDLLPRLRGGDPEVRLVEVQPRSVDEPTRVPGSLRWNWVFEPSGRKDEHLTRDLLKPDPLRKLLRDAGIGPDTELILHGPSHNLFATWAFWQLRYYGITQLRMMEGGREKWEREERPLTVREHQPDPANPPPLEAEPEHRAVLDQVRERRDEASFRLIDVRSEEEYRGAIAAPEGLRDRVKRSGHIPGAVHVPWERSFDESGRFLPRNELRQQYEPPNQTGGEQLVTYCLSGQRSSHSWFVIRYLLGRKKVRNYDGSWYEWGNQPDLSIATETNSISGSSREKSSPEDG